MNNIQSLDDQYIDFVARTTHIFDSYPQLEALRYTFFKDYVVGHKVLNWKGVAKHWMRPVIHKNRRTEEPIEQADVLIRIEGRRETSIDSVARVARELIRRGVKAKVLVSAATTSELGVPYIEFQYPALTIAPSWAPQAWEAFCEVYPALRDPALQRTFEYALAKNRGLFDELNRVFDRVQPKLVILWATQMPVGAAMAVIARERGITCLLLQHGILQPFFTPLIADSMITWGESSNRTLIDLGIPDDRLIPLGSPRHDAMIPQGGKEAKRQMLGALSLPHRPTLAFFSNGNDLVRNGVAPLECALWLEAAAAQFQDQFNIVVRLHPNEDGSLYEGCSHLIVTKNEIGLATMLEGCDVVGSLCSTVLVEGLIYHKPIWQFYADGWPELADNWKTGLATRVSSLDDLRDLIRRVITQGADRLFDQTQLDRVFINHGHATQVVADFVEAQLRVKKVEVIT